MILYASSQRAALLDTGNPSLELKQTSALVLVAGIHRNVYSSTLPLVCGVLSTFLMPLCALGDDSLQASYLSRKITISGNFDGGYRKTQFFQENHNTAVGQWDTRIELWLPPFREEFSFGPYLRFAGIAASRDQPWENALLAAPGGGLQAYPFSLPVFRKTDSLLGKLFGPLRLFGEYNRLDFWGEENSWRPDEQIRAGLEYWRAAGINTITNLWWNEMWGGLSWQSANEFDSHYNSWIFAQALRIGVRKPSAGLLSYFTPYLAVESSLTDNEAYYWENKLSVGAGMRFTPSLSETTSKWLNRLVVYAEYVHVATYYRTSAPSSVPDYDVRVGISFSFGEWYHTPDSYGRVSTTQMKIK